MTGAEKRAWVDAYADESGEELVVADGLDDAIIGIGRQFNRFMVVYDQERCLAIFRKQGMSAEEAEEWMAYNVVGAWVGEATPLYLTRARRC